MKISILSKSYISPDSVSQFYKEITQRRGFGDKNFRLLCFSDSENICNDGLILMWSHYGNEHKGACLHFDMLHLQHISKVLNTVNYPGNQERVSLTPMDAFDQNSFISKCKLAYKTKSKAWGYEKEKRLLLSTLHSPIETDIQTGMEFVRFPPEAITQIDLGMRATSEFKRKLHEVLSMDLYSHVTIKQARMHETEYKIVFDHISHSDLLEN